MTPIDRFRLAVHPGEYATWPERTPLLSIDGATDLAILGYSLRHQFEVDGEFLLITDFDCPFEESTCMTLIDRDLRIRAERSLAVPYGSFQLEKVEVIDSRSLELWFYGSGSWRLSVRERSRWSLRSALNLRRR